MTYTVKQISEILGVEQETVRRWIRSKRLKADISSRKEGNKISEDELKRFLETAPKYLGRLTVGLSAVTPAVTTGVGLAATAGGLAAGTVIAYLAQKKREEVIVRPEDLLSFLQESIEKLNAVVSQKQELIVQTQTEIHNLQEQIRQYQKLIDNKSMIEESFF